MQNDPSLSMIPLDVIAKGRDLEDVLGAYLTFHESASKNIAAPGKSEAEIFADAAKCAVYRLYLLGVQDGMR